jgi:type IV pilus assembly protein PilW
VAGDRKEQRRYEEFSVQDQTIAMIIHSRSRPRKNHGGFSLVELMVALVISLLLIAGVLQVYAGTSKSRRAQDAAALMMDNGRTAIELLSRSARLAGYWKCVGWQASNLSNHLASNQRGLFGSNGADDAPDTLRVLHALDETAVVVQSDVEIYDSETSTANPISVSSGADFSANDLIVINDCAKGDVFQISGVSGNTLNHNCTTCLETYGADSTVMIVEDTQYFIADNDKTPAQPSLFRIVNGGAAEELIEGVESMQIFFGEDTDSDGFANRYVTSEVINAPCADGSNPSCWNRVTSLRISLLLRSTERNVTLDSQVFNFNGQTVTATDNRLRRVFTTVIALRNHRI